MSKKRNASFMMKKYRSSVGTEILTPLEFIMPHIFEKLMGFPMFEAKKYDKSSITSLFVCV